MEDYSFVVQKALDARKFSYAPYSNFTVGAALVSSDDKIFTGCNIESAAYSVCNCAERTAFFKAISEGVRSFEAIAVVGGKKDEQINNFCFPCGVCRQVIQEFCNVDTFKVILSNGDNIKVFDFIELLPFGFSKSNLI